MMPLSLRRRAWRPVAGTVEAWHLWNDREPNVMDRADLFAHARQFMVDGQIRPNKVYDRRLLDALRATKRELFVPPEAVSRAYGDQAVALGGGRYLSEPMTLARLLQLAAVQPGERALVAACGSGYAAALLDAMGAEVTAVEDDPALLTLARAALAATAPKVRLQAGPPTAGFAAGAPYDVMLIDGAVEQVPDALTRQLRPMTTGGGGRLVTALHAGRVTQGVLGEVAGERLRFTVAFDCASPLLPGFEKRQSFVF